MKKILKYMIILLVLLFGCGKEVVEENNQNEEFDYGPLISEEAPTCTAPGTISHYEVNGKYYDINKNEIDDITISPLGHDYIITTHEAPCDMWSVVVYTCSRCGDTFTLEMPPRLEHDYKVVNEVESTCSKNGYIEYKCSVCGKSYKEEKPLDSSIHENTKEVEEKFKDIVIKYSECLECHKIYNKRIIINDIEYEGGIVNNDIYYYIDGGILYLVGSGELPSDLYLIFGDISVDEIIIDSNITAISAGAFINVNTKYIKVPIEVSEIGDNAFSSNQIVKARRVSKACDYCYKNNIKFEGTNSLYYLAIGNSFTNDLMAHFPEVLASYGIVDFSDVKLAFCLEGGRGVGFYSNICKREDGRSDFDTTSMIYMDKETQDPLNNSFGYYEYDFETGSYSRVRLRNLSEALTKYDWDVITVQPYYYETHAFNSTVNESIKNNLNYLVSFVHRYAVNAKVGVYVHWRIVGVAATMGNIYKRTNEVFLTDEGVDFVSMVGTSVESARTTYLNDLEYSLNGKVNEKNDYIIKGLQRDSVHMSPYIGRYIVSITMAEVIMREIFRDDYHIDYHELEKITSIDNTIGDLPKEYMDIIYEAAYNGANNPFEVLDLSSKYGTINPIEEAAEIINNMEFKNIDYNHITEVVSSMIRNTLGSDYKIYEVKELSQTYTTFKLTITLQYGYSFKEVTINGTMSRN